MYEYRCMDETCNKTWTIKEGQIGCTYLTCPFCQKGRGLFIRHIKSEINEDMQKLALRKRDENFNPPKPVNEEFPIVKENKKRVEPAKEEPKMQESVAEEAEKVDNSRKSEDNEIKVIVNTNEVVEEEDDIFERIRKKREQEEELRQNCEEDVDILEISGSTLEELDNRIKEFEEYYYIKILEKKVSQIGKRYNCIIKYCRR